MMGVAQLAMVLTLAAAPAPRFGDAVRLFGNGENERAEVILQRLLEGHPDEASVARIEVYLGLIGLDRLKTAVAADHFRKAILSDATVELPLHVSPKARLIFNKVRKQVEGEMAAQSAPPAPEPRPNLVPPEPAAPPAPLVISAPPPPEHSHLPALLIGAGGLACGAVALVGLFQVLSWNSEANAINGYTAASGAPGRYGYSQVQSDQSRANVWGAVAVGTGLLAVAGLTTAAVTW